MTKEERKLWYDFLKQLPQTVNRQKTIGNYIVDFYCAEAKLVIELDGSQHYEPEGQDAGKRGVPGGHGDRSRGTGALIMREPAVFVFSA